MLNTQSRWIQQDQSDQPPCQDACPLHTDVRGYLILTSAGNFEEAYRVARANNPLLATCGRACSAQCEAACRRGQLDRPLAIRRIKRFLSDSLADERPAGRPANKPTGKSVAIIGAGPAGLSAAHNLAYLGHSVTIFDAATKPGGMAGLGIPVFRLPRVELEKDVEAIESLGVAIRTGIRVGSDITFSEIRAKFDAVFVASGAFRPNSLEIPGAHLDGISLPLPWLEEANLSGRAACGKRMVVIGGGYTAMDVARTAVRLGAGSVSVIYRRTRQEMEVHDEELAEAEEEGVAILYLASPVRFLSNDGRNVSGVEFLRNRLGEPDESGRRRPIPMSGTEFVVRADAVIPAVGQSPDLSFLDESLGSCNGSLHIDLETMRTGLPGVFAGGDCARGPRTIVEAVADGKRAAQSIHRHFGFETDDEGARGMRSVLPLSSDHMYEGIWLSQIPPAMPKTDVTRRRKALGVDVEPTLDRETAVAEAFRCLYCGLQPWISLSDCSLCGACLGICPEQSIEMVAAIGEDGRPASWTRSPKEAIGFAIDEKRCARCGQCARVCPTGAIRFPVLNEAER